jgi:uncharacterized protein (TIGR03437 family)
VSLDGAGDLYVADTGNHRVRKFTPGGIILGVGGTAGPVDAAADLAGNVYIADAVAGRIDFAAASGGLAPFLDGLRSPGGVALDAGGNLYVSDTLAGRVFRHAPSGPIAELGAGRWINPRGIAIAENGQIFVADSGLGQILRIDAQGIVAPVTVDTAIGSPWDVAVGPGGILYVADSDGNRVRMLTPSAAPALIVSAVNAASLLPGPLAPGMLLAIQGISAADPQVLFAGFPSLILAVDDSRILVQAPAQIAGMGQATIEVRDRGVLRASLTVTVADASPALFADSSGQAAAVNADGSLNSPDHPVSRGSWMSLYGTGEGVAGLPVSVRIGAYPAEVLYAGEVVGYPGLFQINVRVPAGYMAPGILSVVLTVGGAASQTGVTVAVE